MKNARRSPKDPSDTEVILSFTSLILLIIYEATKAQANQFIDEIKDICLKNQILEKVVSKMHDMIISHTLFRTRTTKTKPMMKVPRTMETKNHNAILDDDKTPLHDP